MADTNTPAPAPAPAGPPAGPPAADTSGVTNVGGGTLRTTPTTDVPGKTVEEEAAEQALANETPEQKVAREAAAAATNDAPKEGDPKPQGVDLKGTIFEGTSPEMQAKVAPYAAAFAANGTLTDAEVTEAAKSTGFSEAAVRQFMAGATTNVAVEGKPVFEQFGGQEKFNEFRAWTGEEGNLTPREQATINKAINAGDMETAAELMRAPMERWKASGGGGSPRDVTQGGAGGDGGAGQEGDVYGSWADVQADMGKPEYRTNPTFRSKVEQKLARSPLG